MLRIFFLFFSKVITFLPPEGSTGTFYWEDTQKTVIKRWVNELLYVDQYQCYLYKIKTWCGIYYAHPLKYLFRMFTVCSSLYFTEDVIPTFPLFPLIFFLFITFSITLAIYLFISRFNFFVWFLDQTLSSLLLWYEYFCEYKIMQQLGASSQLVGKRSLQHGEWNRCSQHSGCQQAI